MGSGYSLSKRSATHRKELCAVIAYGIAHSPRGHAPAYTGRFFEHDHRMASTCQHLGCGETGDSGAHNDHVGGRAHGRSLRRRTIGRHAC
jgi:hypothetical protein